MVHRSSLLVDLGGTDIKVGVFHPERGITNESRHPFPDFGDRVGLRRTISPVAVLDAVSAAIANALAGSLVPDIIMLSGQMGGWILTDSDNAPLDDIVSWQDNRSLAQDASGASLLDAFTSALSPASVSRVGDALRPGTPAVALYASDLSGFSGTVRFHSLLSWVAASICAGAEFVQHVTDAAASGMLAISNDEWVEEIVALVGSGKLSLPLVSREVVPVGRHSATGAVVYTPIGDQQAALLGAGLQPRMTAFNIATGGQAARLADGDSVTVAQTRPYFDGGYLHTRTHLTAGRGLTKAVSLLSRNDVGTGAWEWAMASTSQRSGLPTVNPDFFSPGGGGWSGVLDRHSAEDLIAAFVVEMASRYIHAAGEVGHKPTDDLLFCGGVAQKFEPLRHLISSSLGGRVTVAPEGDMALRGLSILALGL